MSPAGLGVSGVTITVGPRWAPATAVVLDTAATKLHHGWFEAFVLGIGCNMLVCLAVWAAFSGRTTTDKVLVVTGPIALFVASGFEHSIANMFMIPFALIIKSTAGSEFWAESGAKLADYGDLTWGQFLGGNLLPVTLGNIVGGGVMIGLYYWFIYKWHKQPVEGASAVK